MAERFYSMHTEEAPVFMNYSGPQQPIPPAQAQAQLQKQASFGTASSNEFGSYLASSAYFASASAGIDVSNNNNRAVSSLHYFGSNPNSYSKMLPSGMMSKYASADGSYPRSNAMLSMNPGCMSLTATPDSHLGSGLGSAGIVSGCHYAANGNGTASCYNRNRYMPYSHNRACAAAAAAASAAANPQSGNSSALQVAMTPTVSAAAAFTYPYQPIYQSCFSAAPALTVVTTAQNPVITTSYERATTAKQNAEFSYTHTVAPATLAGTNLQTSSIGSSAGSTVSSSCSSGPITTSTPYSSSQTYATVTDPSQIVTLQITNLDYSMDEASLRNFLLNQLKPITPVVSLVFEGSSYAKVTVPDLYFAKQVVSNLHRKKIGHKRMLVSYTRDSSLTEINTLRCQVAGLLKDVPYYTLPMYKFRELFQSRFKTSISVLDLYKMQDICTINSDNNEEKFISLQPELINSMESSPLMEGLQHSVPYCTEHFKREQHKGWAEQDIEPLPNVCMTISEIQQIIYPLLKNHPGDIPVASLVHCMEGELSIQITPNENGVNLEHLVCCVQGIQIQMNNFGIKILGWLESDKENGGGGTSSSAERGSLYSRNSLTDPLSQISREVIELVKMSPKSTMKFNRFIPAYHNHFGKQCRVADYGYTKLIELFEALSSVVQIMGDGENRQITLTHRTQIRRFTSDLLRVLRAHGNKSVLLSQLPFIFAQTQNRTFDVTDYGVCDIVDILDGLVNSNIVVVSTVQNGKDILISIPKRKQTSSEVEKTCTFAGEMVELFRNAPQYTILFQKFVRSYHYHFAYQCRLSDYGFLKLADLMEAIHGVVEVELTNDEDKKIFLSPKVARRVFAEQCEELIRGVTGSSKTCLKLDDVLKLHKKKFGYQIQPQTLGVRDISQAIELLPYIEVLEKEDFTWIICHYDDASFRMQCYRSCKYLLSREVDASKDGKESSPAMQKKHLVTLADFIRDFNAKQKENMTEHAVKTMKHAIEIYMNNEVQYVRISKLMKFLINIVRMLEQRPMMLLYEIKNSLDCSIATTFKFGYPNLYTLLAGFKDVFCITLGVTQERSEVSLTPNCELRVSGCGNHQHLFGSLKLPNSKQKPQRSSRQPLGEHNNRSNIQGPPAKTRAISSDHPGLSNSNYHTSNYRAHNLTNYTQPSAIKPIPITSKQAAATNIAKHLTPYQSVSSSSSASTYSVVSQQSSILNTSSSNSSSNKENQNTSFNTSSNLFNVSFNSSNSSLSDMTANMSNLAQMNIPAQAPIYAQNFNSTTKLWDRRQTTTFYQQQQELNGAIGGYPSLVIPAAQQQLFPTPTVPNEPAGLYELVNNMQMCPMYEPPKPDTPPSDNMPFWIDPIWTNNSEGAKPKNDLLNIKLPELKCFNVLPMLLSPYTLSKTENLKQKVFSFESHDRKIA